MTRTVVVVALTKLKRRNGTYGHCVGAMDVATGEGVRLLDSTGDFHAANTFVLGAHLKVNGAAPSHIEPPHYEDFWVTSYERLSQSTNLKDDVFAAIVKSGVNVWTGPLGSTFEGKLGQTGNQRFYTSENNPPSRSTWFWIADQDLRMKAGGHYVCGDWDEVKYVGVAPQASLIPKGTLVRLSLARGWKPSEADDDFELRCYLQVSGTY